jgi:MFS family permease
MTAGGSVVAIRGEQEQRGITKQASTRPSWELISVVLPMLLVQIPYAIVLAFVVSIFPGYAVESGLTPTEVGLLLSGFGFVRIAMFSLAGRMARMDERKSIAFAFLGMALVLILTPFDRSFIALLADSCLIGAFIGIIYPQTIAYVSKRSPTENLGFAIGAYETMFGVGFAAGPILSGFVAQIAGVNFALLILAVIALAIIPVLAFPRRGVATTTTRAESQFAELDDSSILLLSLRDHRFASKRMEVNCLVFHPGAALVLFGLVRVVLGAVVVVGVFYLLIKLAGLVDAMTAAKRASARSASPQS